MKTYVPTTLFSISGLKVICFVFVMLFIGIKPSFADKIYILSGTGYDQANQVIVTALIKKGHTVVVGTTGSTTLPTGFTTACIDNVNGYDWLCFFGEVDYTVIEQQIKAYIDLGGKVFYQYEVTCCTTSSTAAAAMASYITGLSIVPDALPSVSGGVGQNVAGWSATAGACTQFFGNAYKCMDGVPLANQLLASATLNGASPPYTDCSNYGMHFSTTDFTGTAHNGAFVALGDVNIWYAAGEPPNSGGTEPVDTNVVNYFFPIKSNKEGSSCALFPPGCVLGLPNGVKSIYDEKNVSVFADMPGRKIIVLINDDEKGVLTIFNSIGQQVYSSSGITQGTTVLAASGFSKGLYIVRVVTGAGTYSRKIILQ